MKKLVRLGNLGSEVGRETTQYESVGRLSGNVIQREVATNRVREARNVKTRDCEKEAFGADSHDRKELSSQRESTRKSLDQAETARIILKH